MILSGTAIERAVEDRAIVIDPFRLEQLNPASYDLTLGDELCVYVNSGADRAREGEPVRSWYHLPEPPAVLDSKCENHFYRAKLSPDGFTVGSHRGDRPRVYLMHTRERIWTRRFVPVIDGKSSLGRLGLAIHVTAGYGDPGFDGQYTLEVVALGESVVLYPGMRIAQIRFHQLEHHGVMAPDYQKSGHYTGSASLGPVPSRSYLQFSREPKTDPAPAPSSSGEHAAVRPCRICSRPDCDTPNGKH